MKKSPRLGTRWRVLKRILRRYTAQKISRRMILSYLGLGVLPIVIVSLVLISLTQSTVQSYLYERNMETARRATNEISLFLKEPLTILNTLAQTRDILEMERFAQSRVINKIKESNSIFQKIFILDQTGKAVVTTSFGEELKDFGREDAYRVAMVGQVYYSQVNFTPSGFPVMLIALPIKKYNRVEGVLVGEIDLKAIWDLVDKITIGETGSAFLLSSDGSVIAHPDKQRVLKKESFADFTFFQEVRELKEGVTSFWSDEAEMIASYASVPELNWTIVVQQPEKEAFNLARRMRERVFIFVALTTLLALALAAASVKKITRPILNLVTGVREYAAGNLEHRIQPERQDELAELAQEFNTMAQSLDKNQKKLRRMERLAALSRFASLVSHEIRNPLNAMNINMQILRRLISANNSEVKKQLKYLDIISSEISRMNSLVTNFLAISRPPELNLIRSDIHRILDEVIMLQEAQAIRDRIQVNKKYTSQPMLGMFDHDQLKQVFHNILINAFEAMAGGGVLTIETNVAAEMKPAAQQRRMGNIRIEDTGEGIPAHKLKDIFEFYYTTKKTGTGLGLAIARQIIQGHAGEIRITSKLKKGTTVIIELPLDMR